MDEDQPAIAPAQFALINRYVQFLQVRSPFTVRGYVTALRHFMRWITDTGRSGSQITRADIMAYVAALDAETSARTGRPLTAGTKAQYLRAVRSVFTWATAEGLLPGSNPAAGIKGARVIRNGRRDAFSAADMRRIVNSIDRDRPIGKRNYTMVLLAVTCGLRVIQLQRANVGDLQTIAGNRVLMIQGKGHEEKDDYMKLTPEVAAAMDDYLSTRPNAKKGDPLFASTSNRAKDKRITQPGISRMIKQLMICAGYDSPRLTAHSLRHTSITMLLKAGATLQQAQDHARHSNPATTEVYAHNLQKITADNESRIYQQIFATNAADDPRTQAAAEVEKLTQAQAAAVLRIMQQIRKDG